MLTLYYMVKNSLKHGRPQVITSSTLQKLEEGFSMWFTDEEASLYANISPSTLYNYGHKFPDFLERKELLKRTLSLQAKRNIMKQIQKGDVKISMWWLEKKNKSEFEEPLQKITENKPNSERMVALQHLFALREKQNQEMQKWYEDRKKVGENVSV